MTLLIFIKLIAIIILLILSAISSGSETALTAVSKLQAHRQNEPGEMHVGTMQPVRTFQLCSRYDTSTWSQTRWIGANGPPGVIAMKNSFWFVWSMEKCYGMGPHGTNLDLTNILGDTDFHFENCYVWDFLRIPHLPDFQILGPVLIHFVATFLRPAVVQSFQDVGIPKEVCKSQSWDSFMFNKWQAFLGLYNNIKFLYAV